MNCAARLACRRRTCTRWWRRTRRCGICPGAVPGVVPAAGHWQAAVLPVATQTWPFMQVVSLPLLKKQPSMSFEQVPTVPAVGQKVPSAVQPRAPLLQVQSPVGRLPVHIWRLPQVLLLAVLTKKQPLASRSQVERTVFDEQKFPGVVQPVGAAVQVHAAAAPVPVQAR